MNDSGKRQEFATGAVRDAAENKPRIDLISPFALERGGIWLAEGALKYSERNWEKGIPQNRCFASCLRHLVSYAAGRPDEDHLAAAFVNTMFLLHNDEAMKLGLLPAELDDMPRYLIRKTR